jgi:hypothetical protein
VDETLLTVLCFAAMGTFWAVDAWRTLAEARRRAPSLSSIRSLPLCGRWLSYALAGFSGVLALLCFIAAGTGTLLMVLSGRP